MNFTDYQAFVNESGQSDAPHSEKVAYAALKLNGESGEVAELVGKAMRSYNRTFADGGDLDKVKLILEIGDVLWYVARLADLHGATLADVAAVNMAKLQRRKILKKDPAGEHEMATRILATRAYAQVSKCPECGSPSCESWNCVDAALKVQKTVKCAWCFEPLGTYRLPGEFCSTYCRRESEVR
jgi:NTP pyrophosphatase (non-canonical NTP hydrolase)